MPRSPQTVNERWHTDPAGAAKAAKPRDSARTRAAILGAAQQLFPLRGYAHVGMREIAALAGVDVKMAARYFGSKEKLFHAALLASVGAGAPWKQPKAGFGRTVVEMFVDELDGAVNPLRMLMQAASDPTAKAVALDFLRTELVSALAAWLGPPDAEARAAQILALCAGLFTYRVMLPLEQFSGSLDPASRRWLEAALQEVVDGRAPAAGPHA